MDDFTAVADCPQCGAVDLHFLDAPNHAPLGDSPIEKVQRRLACLFGEPFDPPGCAVARICRECQSRWPQR